MRALMDLGYRGRHAKKRAALTLLALLDLRPESKWSDAQNRPHGVTPIISFINDAYAPEYYAPNSRENIRDEAIRPFVDSGLLLRNADEPNRPPNSGKTVYQVTPSALEVFRKFGTSGWIDEAEGLKRTLDFKQGVGATPSRQDEGLASLLFPQSDRGEDYVDSILQVPPELRRLNTESYDFSIATIVDLFTKGSIYIPRYQRHFIWSQAQASRLIESLIIQCPIPVIYLNQEMDETLSVIDGNQRLTSIASYLRGDFELFGLTAYPELEGYNFDALDSRFQRHILNRTLRCIVIRKETHPQVKFDVFERLNTGGTPLNAQELRHGIYHGPLMDLVESLAARGEWIALLGLQDDKRMKSDELVIRFFALNEGWREYQRPLFAFLNAYCEQNRVLSEEAKMRLEALFALAIDNCRAIFGEKPFQHTGAQVSFNAAFFDSAMIACASLRGKVDLTREKRAIFERGFRELKSDEEFDQAISSGTNDEQSVKLRISKMLDLFSRYLHG